MKYLLVLLTLFVFGCEEARYKSVEEEIAKRNNDTSYLEWGCLKIGECLGTETTLVHMPNQKHAPYACSVTYKGANSYFYPDTDLGFGDLGNRAFENSVKLCEMIKQVGEYSPEQRAKLKAALDRMDKEAQKRKNKKPEPIKKRIKIEVSQ